MKIKNALTEEQELAKTETALSIDKGSEVFLMSALTNLYTTPLSAVFREVFANAVDANSQAGATNPVDVRVVSIPGQPGPARPWNTQVNDNVHVYDLTVRDYGSGMSRDDLENIYSKYGASTKRSTNKQIGGFGLGAKSPLAITDQFSGFTIKDGHEIGFTIRSRQGASAVLNIDYEKSATRPDGTSITIPVKQGKIPNSRGLNAMASEHGGITSALIGAVGYSTIQTLDKGVAKLNGRDITDYAHTVHEAHEEIRGLDGRVLGWVRKTPDSDAYQRHHVNFKERVNYGIITYAFDSETEKDLVFSEDPKLSNRSGYNYYSGSLPRARHAHFKAVRNIIVNVPLGSLELPPSRDSIIMSAKSKTSIESAKSLLLDTLKALYDSRLQNQATLSDAILFAYEHRDIIGTEWTWRGKRVPAELALPANTPEAGAENGTRWLDVDTVSSVPTHLIAALNMSPVNSRIGARGYWGSSKSGRPDAEYSPNYFVVNLTPETDAAKAEKQQTMVRRLIRDYARAIGSYDTQGGVLPRFALVDPNMVPSETREWLEAYKSWTDFASMKEAVTKFRAEKRTASTRRGNSFTYATLTKAVDPATNDVTWAISTVDSADSDDLSDAIILGKLGSCYSSDVNDLSDLLLAAQAEDATNSQTALKNAERMLNQEWIRGLARIEEADRFVLVASSRNTNRLTAGEKKGRTLPQVANVVLESIIKGLSGSDQDWVVDQLDAMRGDSKGTLLSNVLAEDVELLDQPRLQALCRAANSPIIRSTYTYATSASVHASRQDTQEELESTAKTLSASLMHKRKVAAGLEPVSSYRYSAPTVTNQKQSPQELSMKAVQLLNIITQ